MDKGTAEEILAELYVSSHALDRAEKLARRIASDEESLSIRKAMAVVSMSLYENVMGKIFLQYPELDKYSVNKRGE